MKNCPYCKIDVGGNLKKCPLCQSRLIGEDEEKYFPTQLRLKFQSFFFKLQLFIVWILVISALWLDYVFKLPFGKYGGFHWSLLILMWMFAFEFSIIHVFKKGMDASRIMSIVVVIVMAMVSVTAYYFGQLMFVLYWVIPIMVMCTIVANFVLCMVDKSGNAMVYLLTDLLVGIIPYFVCITLKKDCPIEWMICLLVSFIIFVGAIIFKGREVVGEIQRRLSV